MAKPTDRDIENAAIRAAIADRFRRDFEETRSLAVAVFGPGWIPTCRHFLVEKDEEERARKTGDRMNAAATVYSARRDGVTRHFTVVDGIAVECESVEQGFGEIYHAKHPTRGFEHNGKWIPINRFSLCWAGYEPDYRPRTAEQLAEARSKREERLTERLAQEHPLFADAIISRAWKPQRRSR